MQYLTEDALLKKHHLRKLDRKYFNPPSPFGVPIILLAIQPSSQLSILSHGRLDV
jgi:hypothetical protein